MSPLEAATVTGNAEGARVVVGATVVVGVVVVVGATVVEVGGRVVVLAAVVATGGEVVVVLFTSVPQARATRASVSVRAPTRVFQIKTSSVSGG